MNFIKKIMSIEIHRIIRSQKQYHIKTLLNKIIHGHVREI